MATSTGRRQGVRSKRASKRKGKPIGPVGESLVVAGLPSAAAAAFDAWLKKGKERVVAQALQASAATSSGIEIKAGPEAQRVILLPTRGLRAASPAIAEFFQAMHVHGPAAAVRAAGGPPVKMKVLDSIHEDGPKLVETTAEDLQNLRVTNPSLVVVPERFFDLAVVSYRVEQAARAFAGGVSTLRSVTLELKSKSGAKPIAGATVVAFTDFEAREGAQGITSASGKVTLKLPASIKTLERLYVYPEDTYWGLLGSGVALPSSNRLALTLDAIDLSKQDGLRYFAGAGGEQDGTGVKVAVVDTGIALHHPDLTVAGGECTVPGEKPTEFGPLGGEHGSHCAGIIAAHGSPPSGVRGIAPGASLYSFRVFPKPKSGQGESGASNFAIAKAIDRAVAAGCHLVNMSLGGGLPDQATQAAIEDAYQAGVVCIAAAGNDDRQPVSFPASFDLAVAVSAIGRKGLFPAGSVFDGDVAAPFGTDKKNFVASFTNIGSDLDCTGPGVAIVSTVPERGYAAMSGTSMATPAVTAIAARMLAKNAELLGQARDERRAAAIIKALLKSAKRLGFTSKFVGQGLPK